MAAGTATSDPYLSRALTAKQIYSVTGQPCHPWEVDDYPDDWLTAIRAVAYDIPAKVAKRTEQKLERKRGK